MKKDIFRLFSKSEPLGPIAQQFSHALGVNDRGTQINLYVDEQILFQITHGFNFVENGLSLEYSNDFVELHFFNKNKTHTLPNHSVVQEIAQKEEFIHYEKPKGYHFYFRSIGRNPQEIESLIWNRINTVYSNIDNSRISSEVVIY